MSKASKSLDRLFRGTSDASFSFDELSAVLRRLGFERRGPRGSHYTFAHPAAQDILTVPKRTPVKPVYVRKARALILKHRLADDERS